MAISFSGDVKLEEQQQSAQEALAGMDMRVEQQSAQEALAGMDMRVDGRLWQ